MNLSVKATFGLACVALAALGACDRKEIPCKVGDDCFVCPSEAAAARCHADPSSARCKWAERKRCAK